MIIIKKIQRTFRFSEKKWKHDLPVKYFRNRFWFCVLCHRIEHGLEMQINLIAKAVDLYREVIVQQCAFIMGFITCLAFFVYIGKSWIVLEWNIYLLQTARLQPINKTYGSRAGSQTGHYLNPDSAWPYQGHSKQEPDSRYLASMSGTDIRSGWMSRPQSVLGDDNDMYISPRESDLKPIKSGKSRGYTDKRGMRDINSWMPYIDLIVTFLVLSAFSFNEKL